LPVAAYTARVQDRTESPLRIKWFKEWRIDIVGSTGPDCQPVLSDTIGQDPTMSERRPTPSRERLDSWKAIAAFLGRDERTVNRWEKELGLPVHRLPGTKGRVYAYIDELTRWLAASECPAAFHAHSPNREPNQTSVEFGVVVEGSKGSGSEPLSRSSVE